jgi:hypothetical protein
MKVHYSLATYHGGAADMNKRCAMWLPTFLQRGIHFFGERTEVLAFNNFVPFDRVHLPIIGKRAAVVEEDLLSVRESARARSARIRSPLRCAAIRSPVVRQARRNQVAATALSRCLDPLRALPRGQEMHCNSQFAERAPSHKSRDSYKKTERSR